jgi:hypothetical protein
VQWFAPKALAQIKSPAVRTFAFELVLTDAEWRSQAIDLLRENFQPGDHDIVLNWFETKDDQETLHTEGAKSDHLLGETSLRSVVYADVAQLVREGAMLFL